MKWDCISLDKVSDLGAVTGSASHCHKILLWYSKENAVSGAMVQIMPTIFCCWKYHVQRKTIFTMSLHGLNIQFLPLLMRNTQSMEFPVRYFTLRGKTRISVSEPNGIKLNLYSCNIDYLQKIVLFIILDIFKSIDYHCSEKHFLSDLPIQNKESLLLPVKMSIISPLQLLKLSLKKKKWSVCILLSNFLESKIQIWHIPTCRDMLPVNGRHTLGIA